MKLFQKILFPLLIVVFLGSCKEESQQQVSEFTGNKIVYSLFQATTDYNVKGTVSFNEKVDGSTAVLVEVSGTEGDNYHPLHLHFGPIDGDGDIAALLTPIHGASGRSETDLNLLSDGTVLSYNDLLAMEASIKVHLSGIGDDAKIVLAGGNVGSAIDKSTSNDRVIKITVCKSN